MEADKLIIWGSGVDGALAVHAAEMAGREWLWIGSGEPEELNLSERRLFREIPDLLISWRLMDIDRTGPPRALPIEPIPVWDLREVYEALWGRYAAQLQEAEILPLLKAWQATKPEKRADVVSTLPAPHLCGVITGLQQGTCKLEAETVVFSTQQVAQLTLDTWMFNGEKSPSWSEAGRLFGGRYTEWIPGREPRFLETQTHQRPLSGSCQCWPEIERVGNLATWTPGLNRGEAFWTLYDSLTGEGGEDAEQTA